MEEECSASLEERTARKGPLRARVEGRQPGGNKLTFALLCSRTCVLVSIASTAVARFFSVHYNIFLFFYTDSF